jgi:transcriptional regulator with XRE-family HTH domain
VTALLDGTPEEVQAWGRRQAADRVSCREVLAGRSPRKARAFVSAALKVVHRAVEEVTAAAHPPAAERAYLIKHLHDAVVATAVSPWAMVADDARAAVALEIAQRCRSTPFLHRGREGPGGLAGAALRRLAAAQAGEGWPAASPRLVAFLEGAVLEDLAGEPLHDEYLTKLQRLQHGLGLNTQELARLLRVSRTSIQKWIAGGGLSRDVQARIDEHLAYLARMESHWRPGLLPSILRRRARGLRGRTPLQLILAGQSDEVVEYFDALSDDSATA